MAPNPTIDATIVQLAAPSHFQIKLTTTNYLVWRTQVESVLIGLDVFGYVDGSKLAPAKYSDDGQTTLNPAYTIWFRQDRIILSALLGICSDILQPMISSAPTAADAWKRLASNCAATSRG